MIELTVSDLKKKLRHICVTNRVAEVLNALVKWYNTNKHTSKQFDDA